MSILPCCRDSTALLTEDAEGALEGIAKLKFAIHLSICGACQRLRSQLRTTREVLRELPRRAGEPRAPDANEVDAILKLLAAAPDERED